MRIYRYSVVRQDDENHAGYGYVTSRAALRKKMREGTRSGGEYRLEHYPERDVFDVQLTKAGIMSLLRVAASHPDNG